MDFIEITDNEKHDYWWIQGQVVKNYDKENLANCLSLGFKFVKTVYFIRTKNIFGQNTVDFYLDKNEYDQVGNPISPYIKERLKVLKQYEELGTLEELRNLLANVSNRLDKKEAKTDDAR